MKPTILTGVAAAALTLTACAEADNEPESMAADDAATQGADRAGDATAVAGDPLAGDPEAEGDDGELGSDRTMQGSWTTKRMAGMDAALFGPAESEAAFSVRCDAANRELVFARGAMAPAGDTELTLMAGDERRTIAATSTPDPMPSVTARLSADDAFAGTLAAAREPIAVRVGDRDATFRMPAGAALRDVVSGCRS